MCLEMFATVISCITDGGIFNESFMNNKKKQARLLLRSKLRDRDATDDGGSPTQRPTTPHKRNPKPQNVIRLTASAPRTAPPRQEVRSSDARASSTSNG